jgi:hypothetical protein
MPVRAVPVVVTVMPVVTMVVREVRAVMEVRTMAHVRPEGRTMREVRAGEVRARAVEATGLGVGDRYEGGGHEGSSSGHRESQGAKGAEHGVSPEFCFGACPPPNEAAQR